MAKTTVAAIITHAGEAGIEVLLALRNHEPFYQQWCLPGGHIDLFEPANEAVVREVKEETGLDFTSNFLRYFDEIIPERNIHAVVLVFSGTATGTLHADSAEVADLRWFPLDEAHTMPLAFKHSEILEDYATSVPVP